MLTLPSFINDKISCTKHKVQTATTYCPDCQVFCCLTESCAHPHLFHALENLDSLLQVTIVPALTNLTEINHHRLNSNGETLQSLASLLATSIHNQKKQTEEHYQSIQQQLQEAYQKQMKQFDAFGSKQLALFNQLQLKVDAQSNSIDITDVNNQIAIAVGKAASLEQFIQATATEMPKFNQTLKKAKEGIKTMDFTQEIEQLKASAEKDFELLKRTEEACYDSFMSLIRTQQQSIEGLQLMKEKNTLPKKVFFSFHMKPQSDIDLDIYARNLYAQFNQFRKEPQKVFQLLKLVFEQRPGDSKLGQVLTYLKNLYMNYSLPLPQFEWDNDLSNCSEDYCKAGSGKIDEDPQLFRTKVKDILTGYFNNEGYLNCLKSIAYLGLSDISEVMVGLMMNELNWDNDKHCLFNEKYNLIGIYATPGSQGKIQMIINLGYFKMKE